MLHTQTPIGKFILFTYQEPNLINYTLQEKVENLIDLIKIKTETRGIEHTSLFIQNSLFDIRLELLRFLSDQPDLLKSFEHKILKEIANKYYLSGHNKQLGEIVADCLEVYYKILSGLSGMFSESLTGDTFKTSEMPSLNGLKYVLSLQPSKDLENYLNWVEASLNFDYALIVSDLVFSNVLSFDQTVIEVLGTLLRESITDIGTYLTLTNTWHPEIDDEMQLVRNIKIKVAKSEIENGKSIQFSSEDLHRFITSS